MMPFTLPPLFDPERLALLRKRNNRGNLLSSEAEEIFALIEKLHQQISIMERNAANDSAEYWRLHRLYGKAQSELLAIKLKGNR